ncbi:MAG: phage terminase small subunit P27 family [Phycisphaerae bacterium]|nr:phage terminase small subunit P27 family [Phycisphaerae bacterium]
MGRRGPAPTPTPILKLRGSTLVTQRREAREVRGPSGLPDCPEWLAADAEARAAWDQLVPLLETMGVLTRIDGHALARYCRLWSRWRKAEAFLDKHGEMYPIKDDSGTKTKCFIQWPQVSIALKLAQQLTRLEAEFGMTPSARARIQLQRGEGATSSAKSRFFETA